MGKIKTRAIKRTAERLISQGIEFTVDFEENKRILGDTMPSKKIRNQVAGYLSRLKRREKQKKSELQAE